MLQGRKTKGVMTMSKKMYRIGGTIEQKEKEEFLRQMSRDGFTAMWTWMIWVIRQHIQKSRAEDGL